MRSFASIAFGLVVLAVGCNERSIVDACPTGGRTGSAPACILTTQCKATNVGFELDCSGNDGSCVCLENGIVGATVPYEGDFCTDGDASDYTSLEGALEAANSACKWNIH